MEVRMPVIPMPEKKKSRGRPKHAALQKASKILDQHELMLFWSAIVRGEIGDDDEAPKLNERLRASELIAKANNMFNTNITLNNGQPTEQLSDEELDAKMKALMEMMQ
jgi:hypothetical protein